MSRNICAFLLVLGILAGQASAQQKIVFIASEKDVVDGCVEVAAPTGKGQILMAPLVPSGTQAKPDIYSMTYFVDGTNRIRNLIFSFDRGDKFVGYNEVVLTDGKALANQPFQQIPANGRFGESHLLPLSDAGYEKALQEGMKLKWRTKGKKGDTSFEIPAYFFTGFNQRLEKMVGTAAKVAKVEPASPYIQSGSIGKKADSKTGPKLMSNELSYLKGTELIGQTFIFMPQLTKEQSVAYTFGDGGNPAKRLPYEKYVGKMVKIITFNTDQEGNEFYGGTIVETGEIITMQAERVGPKLFQMALKRDIDFAREKFIGKKVWLRDNAVYTFNDETEEVLPHAKPKFTEYTVQNVVLGTMLTPVRFILVDAEGNTFFRDIDVSRSNTHGASAELFDYVFFDKNPREIFSNWPDDVFRMLVWDWSNKG